MVDSKRASTSFNHFECEIGKVNSPVLYRYLHLVEFIPLDEFSKQLRDVIAPVESDSMCNNNSTSYTFTN